MYMVDIIAGSTARASSFNGNNFEVLQVLGTGAAGKVYRVLKKDGIDQGKIYAMKVLTKASTSQRRKIRNINAERQVLELVYNLPFLVNMHYAFQTDTKLHLILEYVNGGDLFTHLKEKTKFLESEAQIYIGELILAVEHLHKLGIMHRDIKTENVLLDKDGHVVLIDFGLSKIFTADDEVRLSYSYCGTLDYMAPEIINKRGSAGYGMAVDWWSVGVLAYELLNGSPPFSVIGSRNSDSDICERILSFEPPQQSYLSNVASDFLSKLLTKNPKKRLGGGQGDAMELKCHPFFEGLNWEDLVYKKIPAPFIPSCNDEQDITESENESASIMSVDSSDKESPALKTFTNYSYIAPSVNLSNC